jgi:hypothetical protein
MMEFSTEGNRNHAACVATLERMTPDELTPGKPKRYAALYEATDHGRFASTTEQVTQAQEPVLERDDEAAARLREWAE